MPGLKITKNELSLKGYVWTNLLEDQSCPQKTSTFGDCMACGIAECGQDWVCAATLAVAPIPTLAGFALGCTFG